MRRYTFLDASCLRVKLLRKVDRVIYSSSERQVEEQVHQVEEQKIVNRRNAKIVCIRGMQNRVCIGGMQKECASEE